MEGLNTSPARHTVYLGNVCEPTFKELSPLVKGKTVRLMPLPHDKSQKLPDMVQSRNRRTSRCAILSIK